MPIPQVNERIKEAPVVVLRAVFAGIGQILLTADKVRARAAEQVWTPERAPAVLPADRQATEPPRNGATRTESAVTGHSAVREAPAPPTPVSTNTTPGTKTTPATKGAPGTKAPAAAKAAPAAKTGPATRAPRPAKATPAAKAGPAAKATPAAKAGPAAKATPAAKPAAKAPPAAKTTRAAKTTPDTTAPRATKAGKTVPAPRAAKAEPAAQAPPLPGYDDLSIASLRARLRVLDAPGIEAMLAYEKAHARREPVITMLERRLAKISAG
jgi:hypothetical protein